MESPDSRDMYTQCPKCEAVFTIAQDQLDHRDGVVRCGACMGVFDATSHLHEQIPTSADGVVDVVPVQGVAAERSAVLADANEGEDLGEAALGYQSDELIDQVEAELADFDIDRTDGFEVEQIEMETPQWAYAFDEDKAAPQPLVNEALSDDDALSQAPTLTTTEPEVASRPLVVDDADTTNDTPAVPYSVAGLANTPRPGAAVFGSSASVIADDDPDGMSVEEFDNINGEWTTKAAPDQAVEQAVEVIPDVEAPQAESLIWPSAGSNEELATPLGSEEALSPTPTPTPTPAPVSSVASLIEVDPSVSLADAEVVVSAGANASADGLSFEDSGLSLPDASEVSLSVNDTGKSDEVVLSLDVFDGFDEEDEEDANEQPELLQQASTLVVAQNTAIDLDNTTIELADTDSDDDTDDSLGEIDLEASINAAFALDAPVNMSPDDLSTMESSISVHSDVDLSADVFASDNSAVQAAEAPLESIAPIEDKVDDAPEFGVLDDVPIEQPAAVQSPVLTAPDVLERNQRIEPVLSAPSPTVSENTAAIDIEAADLDDVYAGLDDEVDDAVVAPLQPNESNEFDEVEFDDDEFLARTGMDFDVEIDSELVSELEFVAQLERAGVDDLDFDSDDFIQEHHAQKSAESEQATPAQNAVLDPIAATRQRASEAIPELSGPVSFGVSDVVAVPAWKTWSTRAALSIGCLGLVATLVWQAKSFYLEDLAQVPALRPALSTLCDWTSCDLPPRRSPDHMSLIATYIDSHPEEPDALRIATQITNSAAFSQPYPNVRLTMTDKRGRIVARRDVTPKEYLAVADITAALIEPGETEQVFFDLMDPRDDAFGYEVELLAAD